MPKEEKVKVDEQEVAEHSDERPAAEIPVADQPESLNGSGAPTIEVTAQATVLGMLPGESRRLVDSQEIRACIASGVLSLKS